MRRSMLAAAVVSGAVAFSTWGQAPAAPPTPGVPGAPGGAPAPTPVTPTGPAAPVPRPAPALAAVAADAPNTPTVKKEKLTFLGLNISVVNDGVREQLKLPGGVGIHLDAVDPGGPAEQAGLRPGDILEKIDDQWCVNVKQFTAVIRAGKPGYVVTLSIYRDGKPQQVKATLGQKEVVAQVQPQFEVFDPTVQLTPAPVAANDVVAAQPPVGLWLRTDVGRQATEWADEEHVIKIEKENGKNVFMEILDKKTGKKVLEARPPDAKVLEELAKTMPALRGKLKQAEEALNQAPRVITPQAGMAPGTVDVFVNQQFIPGGGGGGRALTLTAPRTAAARGAGRVATWQDDDQLLVLRFAGNTPTYLLALSKKDGRTIYDGPVMTAEQRSALPADVAEQFEMLKSKPDMAAEFGGPQRREQAPKPAENKAADNPPQAK